MAKPAHKQDDPAKAPGQLVNAEWDKTLKDYLKRKELISPTKLTFDQWWGKHMAWQFPEAHLEERSQQFLACWIAAQENKADPPKTYGGWSTPSGNPFDVGGP